MNIPGKRLILGAAVAVAALGVGGVAYASADDPAPEQGYVTVDEDATTPSPGTNQQQNGTREDCPEKNGQGQGQGEGEQTQPSQPEQTQPDAAENA